MTTGLAGYRQKQLTAAQRMRDRRWADYMADQTFENFERWNRMRRRVDDLEMGIDS